MEWFETHAHLGDEQFDHDREDVLRRAVENNVAQIVEIADGPKEWNKSREIAEQNRPRIWWAAGIHPYYADQAGSDVIARLRDCTQHPQFVAIGEVGLDYAKCEIPKDRQISAFGLTLDLAEETQKPLIIHCREAYPDLLEILKARYSSRQPENLSPGVVHCFSGNVEQGKQLVEWGFFLGVDAPITYPKAESLRTTLKSIPIENLVIETDSPYLPPQPYRGKRNEPAYLPLVAERLAEIKEIAPEKLATILRQNSVNLFRLNRAEI